MFWNLKKKIQMNLYTKNTHSNRKQMYGCQSVEGRGRIKLGEWD